MNRVLGVCLGLSILLMMLGQTLSASAHESQQAVDAKQIAIAEGVVRRWPGLRQQAKLQLRKVEKSAQIGGYTQLVFDAIDEGQTFGVNLESAEVYYWRDNNYQRGSHEQSVGEDARRPLPVDTIAANALEFVREHLPEFDKSRLKQRGAWQHGTVFVRQLDNGVWDDTLTMSVHLDPFTGETYFYELYRATPVHIPTTPKISKEIAEAVAVGICSGMLGSTEQGHAKSHFVASNYGLCVCHDDIGLQRLVWSMDVVISSVPGMTLERYLETKDHDAMRLRTSHFGMLVDASTGELVSAEGYDLGVVLDTYTMMTHGAAESELPAAYKRIVPYQRLCMSLAGSEDHPLEVMVPPLLIDGVPYLYIRCIAAMLDRKVSYDSQTGIVMLDGEEVQLGTKSTAAGGDEHPVKLLFDRLYLPLSTANRLFDCEIKWNPTDKMLVFPQSQ